MSKEANSNVSIQEKKGREEIISINGRLLPLTKTYAKAVIAFIGHSEIDPISTSLWAKETYKDGGNATPVPDDAAKNRLSVMRGPLQAKLNEYDFSIEEAAGNQASDEKEKGKRGGKEKSHYLFDRKNSTDKVYIFHEAKTITVNDINKEEQGDKTELLIKGRKLSSELDAAETAIIQALAESSRTKTILGPSLVKIIAEKKGISVLTAKRTLKPTIDDLQLKLNKDNLSIEKTVAQRSDSKGAGRLGNAYYLEDKLIDGNAASNPAAASFTKEEPVPEEEGRNVEGTSRKLAPIGTIFPEVEAATFLEEDLFTPARLAILSPEMPIHQRYTLSIVMRGGLYRETLMKYGFKKLCQIELDNLNRIAGNYNTGEDNYLKRQFPKHAFKLLSQYLVAFCNRKEELINANSFHEDARIMLHAIPKGMEPEEMMACVQELWKVIGAAEAGDYVKPQTIFGMPK